MASGYIQSAYYAANGEYGYKIHDGLSGSMHDHVLVRRCRRLRRSRGGRR